MNGLQKFLAVLFLNVFFIQMGMFAQSKPSLQVEGKNISTEEDLVISISSEQQLPNGESPSYQFPEINFFRKIGVSRGKASKLVNNQLVNVVIYSQHYRPINAGIIQVPALEFLINQQSVKSDPFSVTVVKALESPAAKEEESALEVPKEVLVNKNKIFLLVSSNVYRPFVGQGFTLKFSLFIPENNVEELSFDRNDLQIPLQLQKLKPSNCWQENFDLQQEKVISTIWQGVKYKEYRFFQSTFYPLDNQIIRIPSLYLRLLKTVRKGSEVQKTPVEFASVPFQIVPKKLPVGISPTKIPIGNYELKEQISKSNASTRETLTYTYSFIGDGNTFAIEEPEVESDYFLRFTTLSKEELIFPFRDKMFGNISQKIQIIPKQPGKFALKKYFYWVYFNTQKARLDTLFSTIVLDIKGKPEDAKLDTHDETSEVYRGIENISSVQTTWNTWSNWQRVANLVIISLFIVVVFLVIGTRKK
ncbi:MAG: hypothetical protein RI995_880 [Bacteroidota bacterium]